ncbi:MAG: CIA30 family protein [Actinomycetota bacterium]
MLTRFAGLLVPLGLLLVACGTDEAGDPVVAVVDAPVASTVLPSTTESAVIGESSTTTSVAPTTAAPTPTASTVVASTISISAGSTTTSTISTVPADCRRLEEFDEPGGWFIVNDGVMGGRSDGQAVIGESTLRFTGTVVTAGGGFTSIRLGLDDGALAGTETIRVRLRPDTRTYGLTLEDDQTINGRRISHGADLPAPVDVDDDGYVVVEVPHAVLEPTVFGQLVLAEPFRPDAASEIGIIISDGVDGPFSLDVDWIEACG